MFQRVLAIVVLAVVAIPVALACYCMFRYGPPTLAPTEVAEPGLYALGKTWSPPCSHGLGFEWSLRYHIGMRRDDIRRNMAYAARLVASASRPDKGWAAMEKDTHGLAHYVTDFEGGQRSSGVAACDLYEGGENCHVLFFDDAGVLVGVHCFPSVLYLSKLVEPANEAMHRMSGHHVSSVFGTPGRPLIGDLDRSPSSRSHVSA